MIDELAAQLALRNRALSLVVATTGVTTLSATATGYARVTGSFVDDGFEVGMDVQPAGFVANTVGVISALTDTTMTTFSSRGAEGGSATCSLVAGIPLLRAWENEQFPPTAQRPYISDAFIAATSGLRSFPAQGATLDESGLYVLTWYGLSQVGIRAIRKSVTALKALYAPGTVLVVGASALRVKGSPTEAGPSSGQLVPVDGGWSAVVITIPWRGESINAIAA